MFTVTLALVVIGVLMVFSASAIMAAERYGSAYHFFWRQLLWAVAGFAILFGLSRVDYTFFKRPAVVFGLLGITTALLFAVYFLDRAKGAHRWVHVSIFSLQPSELAKPALVIFLAWFLEPRLKQIEDVKGTLLPLAIVLAVICGLILKEPDLGTTLVCAGAAAIVLYVAGLPLKYYGYAAIPIIPLMYWQLFHVGFRRDRMLVFLHPDSDPQGKGFHMVQSLIAVGTGGLTGRGLMEGKQKLFYLPEPHTDFIFAVTAEELGLLGALTIVILFGVFAFRGLRTAYRTNDSFGRLMALGITSIIVVQALFNISVVIGLLPTKGIPLPFISYGGTSIAVTLAMVGVLLNISKQTE
jgi:cell division protein FtsW